MWLALSTIAALSRAYPGNPDVDPFVAGIRHALMDVPGLTGEYTRHRPFAPGTSPAGMALAIHSALEWHRGPATDLFDDLTDTKTRMDGVRGELRVATAGEAHDWGTSEGADVYERTAEMVADIPGLDEPVTCTVTRLRLLPRRLPGEAWDRIRRGEPCGRVLGPWGMVRDRRRVKSCGLGEGVCVQASAELALFRRKIGAGGEDVPWSFAEWLAKRAAIDGGQAARLTGPVNASGLPATTGPLPVTRS